MLADDEDCDEHWHWPRVQHMSGVHVCVDASLLQVAWCVCVYRAVKFVTHKLCFELRLGVLKVCRYTVCVGQLRIREVFWRLMADKVVCCDVFAGCSARQPQQ